MEIWAKFWLLGWGRASASGQEAGTRGARRLLLDGLSRCFCFLGPPAIGALSRPLLVGGFPC